MLAEVSPRCFICVSGVGLSGLLYRGRTIENLARRVLRRDSRVPLNAKRPRELRPNTTYRSPLLGKFELARVVIDGTWMV